MIRHPTWILRVILLPGVRLSRQSARIPFLRRLRRHRVPSIVNVELRIGRWTIEGMSVSGHPRPIRLLLRRRRQLTALPAVRCVVFGAIVRQEVGYSPQVLLVRLLPRIPMLNRWRAARGTMHHRLSRYCFICMVVVWVCIDVRIVECMSGRPLQRRMRQTCLLVSRWRNERHLTSLPFRVCHVRMLTDGRKSTTSIMCHVLLCSGLLLSISRRPSVRIGPSRWRSRLRASPLTRPWYRRHTIPCKWSLWIVQELEYIGMVVDVRKLAADVGLRGWLGLGTGWRRGEVIRGSWVSRKSCSGIVVRISSLFSKRRGLFVRNYISPLLFTLC